MAGTGTVLRGRYADNYVLTAQLGVGGEGTVYEINDPQSPGYERVAKIYHTDRPNIAARLPELERKLTYMATGLRMNFISKESHNCLVTWPEDVLYDNGRFVGYIMPKIRGAKTIQLLCRGGAQAQMVIPGYNRRTAVKVAANLAKVIAALHARGIVVGDMNSNNISVYPNGDVVLLDTDSFDIRIPGGEHFKCKVATAPYLAPELHGKDLNSPDAAFTRETDEFSLAIHIFQLLTGNYHPFNVKQADVSASGDLAKQDYNIIRGNCPFVKQVPGGGIPAGAPELSSVLSPALIGDFTAAFGYTLQPGSADYPQQLQAAISGRTAADRWNADLLNFYNDPSLGLCPKDPQHYVLQGCSCGFCAAEERQAAALRSAAAFMAQAAAKRSAPGKDNFSRAAGTAAAAGRTAGGAAGTAAGRSNAAGNSAAAVNPAPGGTAQGAGAAASGGQSATGSAPSAAPAANNSGGGCLSIFLILGGLVLVGVLMSSLFSEPKTAAAPARTTAAVVQRTTPTPTPKTVTASKTTAAPKAAAVVTASPKASKENPEWGWGEQVTVKTQEGSVYFAPAIFKIPISGCKSFDLSVTVTDHTNSFPEGYWRVYARNQNNSWTYIGKFLMDKKTKSGSRTIELQTDMTITGLGVAGPKGWSGSYSTSQSYSNFKYK